jgi:hypothetical protein
MKVHYLLRIVSSIQKKWFELSYVSIYVHFLYKQESLSTFWVKKKKKKKKKKFFILIV